LNANLQFPEGHAADAGRQMAANVRTIGMNRASDTARPPAFSTKRMRLHQVVLAEKPSRLERKTFGPIHDPMA